MEPGFIGNNILVFSGFRHMCNLLVLLALWFIAPICVAEASPQTSLIVTHKLPELNSDERVLHEVEVLQLALDKTVAEFGPYELRGIPPMNRARTLVALSHNVYPNLILQMSYEDELAEQESLAFIPFPLDRGALSYRICFMRDSLNATAKSITHLDQFEGYHFGVGIGWADGKILRHNRLQVVESNSVVSLFRMTKAGRIDFFCRGASEFFYEQQDPNSLGLTGDTHLALYYPLPKFFFAHKDTQVALNRVQKGLEIAYRDGSFNKLWSKRHLNTLERANLKQRNLIQLENPLIKHLARDYETYLYDPINQ
ncbi:MAG: hypothetical protein Q7T48_05085 [Cellvibrio sp.]|uniref:hypothetical protein n=1 Tax=Cellvibrio sp. TaxID=1965322 RepID=UPI00271BB304|nr:hypothetical protein [Cellvibrio sp.]